MDQIVETHKTQIQLLYNELKSLDESFTNNENHSEEWNRIFDSMLLLTKTIAEETWPAKIIKQLSYENLQLQDKYKYTSLEYAPLDYEKTLRKILKYYNPDKLFSNEASKAKYHVSFWDYYLYILKKDVYKRHTQVKIEEINKHRTFKISVRKQRKINKMLYLVKKYNRENPETKISLYSETAKDIFMENNLFKNRRQMESLLELNRTAYEYDSTFKASIIENIETTDSLMSENNSEQIEYFLKLFTYVIEKSFLLKMKQKKQNPEAQAAKEIFEKEIITCYYLNKLSSKLPNVNIFQILDAFKNKAFTSQSVINLFEQREALVIASLQKKSSSSDTEIKQLQKNAPASLESISLAAGKQKNYGTRRITDFRKFTKMQLPAITTDFPELKELLEKWI